MTTITDVAAFAGVGIGTVSRVMNGSEQVRPATRAKVLAAVEELGYSPHRGGPKTARQQGGYIGVLVHFFEGQSAYERLRGIVSRLQPHGFEVVLDIVDSPERARERLMELPRNRQLDGLIVMSLPLRLDEGERLANARFPTVLVDTAHPALPSVTIDDREGGRMSTRHLLDLGHDRVAFVGEPPRNPFGFIASRYREEGYREIMEAHGLDVPAEFIKHGPHLRSAGRQLAMELFARADPPTAIVAASDLHGIGILEAARESGRVAGKDFSLIGFDDIDMASFVGLSTIRQPLERSGQRGAELVLSSLQSDIRPTPFNERLELELIIRQTTGPATARQRRKVTQ
jgi:DNA-binding LacI/PurR family transcriptional regulator